MAKGGGNRDWLHFSSLHGSFGGGVSRFENKSMKRLELTEYKTQQSNRRRCASTGLFTPVPSFFITYPPGLVSAHRSYVIKLQRDIRSGKPSVGHIAITRYDHQYYIPKPGNLNSINHARLITQRKYIGLYTFFLPEESRNHLIWA